MNCASSLAGTCHHSITGTRKTKKYNRTDRTAVYDYYRCTHKSLLIKCVEKPVKASEVKDQFVSVLENVELDSDFQIWAEQFYKEIDDYDFKDAVAINNSIENAVKTDRFAIVRTSRPQTI